MKTFSTASPWTTPYSSARYGWRFVNYLYMLAHRPPSAGLVLRASTGITLSSLRQKIMGGRHFITSNPGNDATELSPLAGLADQTRTQLTLESCVLTQREEFMFNWGLPQVVSFPYLNTLKVIDNFLLAKVNTIAHATTPMCIAAQEALKEYTRVRPAIREAVIGDCFIHLRK